MTNCELQQLFLEGVRVGKAHNEGTGPSGEDINFCRKALRLDFEVKCHLGLWVSHIGETKYNLADTLAFWQDPTLYSRLEQTTYVWRKSDG